MKLGLEKSIKNFFNHYFIFFIGFSVGCFVFEYYGEKNWSTAIRYTSLTLFYTVSLFLHHRKIKFA